MSNSALELLHIQKRLKNSGFTQEQAETQAEILAEVIELRSQHDNAQLATKQDVSEAKNELQLKMAELKHDLELKMANIKSELELKIAETKTEVIRWVLGISIAQTSIILAFIKYFH